MKRIKFYNLPKLNKAYKKSFFNNLKKIIDKGYFINGEETKTFEKNFSQFCNARFCVGVGNGLDALRLALLALIELKKIKKNSEVLVAANTYIATILAISSVNLKPVLVEPCADTFNIDPKEIKKKISKKTKVILVTHLYGQAAKMNEIKKIATQHKLSIVEDAAQAHGAKFKKQIIGSIGDATCFSFFPGKNLGAFGDSGAVTTENRKLAEIIKSMRNYGENLFENILNRRYLNSYKGLNSRMDEFQASILNLKIKKLNLDNNRRKKIASFYLKNIKNKLITLPAVPNWTKPAWYLFIVKCKERNKFRNYLKKNGIDTMIHYPLPPHKQKAYKEFNNKKYPITEAIHRTVVSLPISPTLKNHEIKYIAKVINNFTNKV